MNIHTNSNIKQSAKNLWFNLDFLKLIGVIKSYDTLAKEIGISNSAIYTKRSRDEMPSFNTIFYLCHILEIPMEHLLFSRIHSKEEYEVAKTHWRFLCSYDGYDPADFG